MPHLNDTQRVILAHASQRQDCSLYPLPGSLREAEPRIVRAINVLIKTRLVEKRAAPDASGAPRSSSEANPDLYITSAGLAAIGISDVEVEADNEAATMAVVVAPSPARTSKVSAVVALLSRDDGATTPELIDATGWLPHTTRAALTGLRKKGHAIERSQRDGTTCYRIVGAA